MTPLTVAYIRFWDQPESQDSCRTGPSRSSDSLRCAGLIPVGTPRDTWGVGAALEDVRGQALGLRLKSHRAYAALYSSPLGRAVETAVLLGTILGELPVETDARLVEYDFGAWDGLTPAELRAHGFWEAVQGDPEFAPPLGELFGAAARRVATALQEVATQHPATPVIAACDRGGPRPHPGCSTRPADRWGSTPRAPIHARQRRDGRARARRPPTAAPSRPRDLVSVELNRARAAHKVAIPGLKPIDERQAVRGQYRS